MFEANKHVSRRAQGARRAAARGNAEAQLSALLASQDAGDLPRHRAMVHQHGASGSAQGRAARDRQSEMDAGVGREPHRQHDRRPSRLVYLAPARVGRAACAVRASHYRRAASALRRVARRCGRARRERRHRCVGRPRSRRPARRRGEELREGQRHPRRVVRLGRVAPVRVEALARSHDARRPVPGRLRSASRLVSQLAADVGRAA